MAQEPKPKQQPPLQRPTYPKPVGYAEDGMPPKLKQPKR